MPFAQNDYFKMESSKSGERAKELGPCQKLKGSEPPKYTLIGKIL